MKNNKLFLNIDINSATCPFLSSVMAKGCVEKEDLYPFVDQYIDLPDGRESQIGTILFNTFCQFSSVDSQYMTDCRVYTEKKLANGDDVSDKWYYAFYRMNNEFGIEPWGVFIERCRERGCDAWISLRMNDAHDTDYEECLKDEFAFRAKWRDYAIGDRYGYYWKCLDYSHEEVRRRFLGYIAEQLERYDIDGIELDFMREIYCFDYINNPDCAEIMTDFMRNVRKLVNSSAEKRGHAVKLSVRLMRDIEQNRVFGFDVDAWYAEKLVDYITVTPRWASSDSDMPIAEWVKRFPDIKISAGVETLLRFEDFRRGEGGVPNLDSDMVNALAANYISQGADQINLYNYFLNPHRKTVYSQRTFDILARCGDKETIFSTPRRHAVMYQDIAPEGFEAYRPLPLVSKGKKSEVSVMTGRVPYGKRAELYVAFSEGSPDDTEICVNGIRCSGFAGAVIPMLPPEANISDMVWKCDITLDGDQVQTVSFMSENAVVNYVEIKIS